MSLYDRPDPRRLDLRASLRSLTGEWLVRVNRQRAGLSVYAVVDVSASMTFGVTPKLNVVSDFLESLGISAFRSADAVGLLAFDSNERDDLFVPARISRGAGSVMSATLRQGRDARGGARRDGASHPWASTSADARGDRGLERTTNRLAGRAGLVFIVSDFHWPLDRLGVILDLLANAFVVPLVVWDPAETVPPAKNGFALLRDAETSSQRALWLRPSLRTRWRDSVANRRRELERIFASRSIAPVYMEGEFDSERLSRYFLEGES